MKTRGLIDFSKKICIKKGVFFVCICDDDENSTNFIFIPCGSPHTCTTSFISLNLLVRTMKKYFVSLKRCILFIMAKKILVRSRIEHITLRIVRLENYPQIKNKIIFIKISTSYFFCFLFWCYYPIISQFR